ncbi:hypothetical protein LGH70_22610 [Hymenobacter sp. BT635]|uniref:Uncharacterized protein n=1 Tax=Hymenobacter nitidus TaxID=2880929 RepID=A0ABS8AJ83_9BACT|nr:hypothetical protein [Hymenobacter nitidus]MCB2380402.1 hypothetical protein [Hymenobacter nitidus]
MVTPFLPATSFSSHPTPLSPAVQQAVALLSQHDQPQVRELGAEKLTYLLVEPLAGLPLLLGHTNTLTAAEDIVFLAQATAEMILMQYPAFRFPEICFALRRGASGEWKTRVEEVVLLSLPSIRHWLQSYQQQCRAAAIQLRQAAAQDVPVPNSEVDFIAMITSLAASVKVTGCFPHILDPGSVLYGWLKQIGAFKGFKTPAQYVELQRKESLRISQTREASSAKRGQQDSFAKQLRRGWPVDHPLAETILNNCRKRLLWEWICYHNAKGTDLHSWLTELGCIVQKPQAA